jgi:hypothetical protein
MMGPNINVELMKLVTNIMNLTWLRIEAMIGLYTQGNATLDLFKEKESFYYFPISGVTLYREISCTPITAPITQQESARSTTY